MSDLHKSAIEGTAEWNERRMHNRSLALMYAKAGLVVFPSSGKTPCIPGWQQRDNDMSPEQREEATARFREKHDRDPIHVGATSSSAIIKKLWRAFPDAVPSISTGPSGLLVIDADSKNDGPAKVREFFDAHGGLPAEVPVTHTQSGGLHIFFRNDCQLGSKAGALKALGCDVRGSGGQVVAPVAWREDGRRYTPDGDHARLAAALKDGSLPATPAFVREAIGEPVQHDDNVTHLREREVVQMLREGDWSEHENDFEPSLGDYDLEQLKASNPKFAELYDEPSEDCSANRFKATRMLMTEWPDMPVLALAVFLRDWPGAGEYVDESPRTGEYDDRQVAREWLKNQGFSKPSNGDAFEPVDDDDDEPAEKPAVLPYVRDSYLVANYKPMRWLVKRLIPLNSVGALYGLPNVGKSFVVFDLASHARRGRDWFGRKTTGGEVLYLYAEGAAGIAGRAKAWADNNDPSGGSVALMDRVPNLFSDQKAVKKIVAAARACEAESGEPVRLIVVDTLAAATPGANGSSDEDMGLVCDRLRKVANELDCAVLVVHHSGKDASKGMRGSSAILGAVDFSLLVDEKAGRSTLSVEKMRDARKGQSLRFKLVEVVIGKDEDREDVTSCIVRPVEVSEALGAVDDGEDEEMPPAPDGPAEKLTATMSALERCATEIAETTGDRLNDVGISKGEVFKALNRDRKAAGLAALKDPTMVTRLLDRLVRSGQIVKTGENRRTEYRVTG